MTKSTDLLALTADIVSSHVSNNSVSVTDIPGLISKVYAALAGAGVAEPVAAPVQGPAVSIRTSVKPDYIVCLEDGKKLKMLKRHLMTSYGITPDAYRAKWNLPADYPMVAPNYAAQRRSLAIKIGLGSKRSVEPEAVPVEVAPVEPPAAQKKRRVPRKPKASAPAD